MNGIREEFMKKRAFLLLVLLIMATPAGAEKGSLKICVFPEPPALTATSETPISNSAIFPPGITGT